jgi:hypothetical protein
LHFEATVPSTPGGPFNDSAGGTAGGGFTVVSSGATAPVTVTKSGTTTTTCNAGQTCQSSLSTSMSAFQVAASSGSTAGTLSEGVNVGSPLVCPGYTPLDPNWYTFSVSVTSRTKAITYMLHAKLPGLFFCFGAPYEFKTILGTNAAPHVLPDGTAGFTGLLPPCIGTIKGPCVSSLSITGSLSAGFKSTLVVQIPAGLPGDPMGRA